MGDRSSLTYEKKTLIFVLSNVHLGELGFQLSKYGRQALLNYCNDSLSKI